MKNNGVIYSKIIKTIVFILLLCGFTVFPVYAEEETETAGSSLGKEVLEEDNAEMYSERAARAAGWVENSTGWRYYDSNGQYLKSVWWVDPSGKKYWFEADGYMATGWRKIEDSWHYFTKDGYWIDQSQYSKYENNTLKGIDVSKWQAGIDWKAVKKDGIQFAFIRLGFSGNDQNLDNYYEKNMKEANEAGIPVGVYYYSKATTVEMAIKEAQFTIDHMKGYLVSYPVAFDVEDDVQKKLGKDTLAKIIKAFCDEIRAAGYTPMLYTNEDWYKNCINMGALQGEELWVARYNYYYDTAIPRGIWQSSSTSRVNGVSGNVDIDFGYKDYTKIVTPRTSAVESYKRTNGTWVQGSNGKWWYQFISGGYPADKWEQISGKWYLFDKSGYMLTGWQAVGGKWYYLDSSGVMKTGWQSIGGKWYYLNGSGVMLTGWQKIGNTWYYLNSSGVMLTGWQSIGGKWYYLNSSGAMAIGWLQIGTARYYMSDSGVMLTGWQSIGGKWYYFNGSGAMVTGWQKIGNVWYYLDTSGVMLTGWQSIGGKWYYLSGSGAMKTGWLQTGSTWYYLDGSGVMKTGWLQIGSTWYYLDGSGAMKTGWQTVNGAKYYFYSSGAMATGERVIDGVTYNFGSDGKCR